MSKYTTELRYICEKLANLDESKGYNDIDTIIETARPKIFNFDYPIFDSDYKPMLESKIISHFYTREIGAETVGLWKLWLKNRLNEIMPYYNQLYKSELIKFNPLHDTDLTTQRNDELTSNRNDDNTRNIIDNGENVTNRDNFTNVKDSGKDDKVRTGNVVEANQHGHVIEEAYDDRNNSNDESTVKTWKNSNTTDWHYASDTPQSKINQVDDNVYASGVTKDVHIQKNGEENTYSDDKPSTHENFDYERNKVAHNAHNDTVTTNSGTDTDTTTYNSVKDETNYGKNTDTTLQGRQVDKFGKTVYDKNDNVRNFNSIDDWLEHMVGKRSPKSYSEMLNEFRSTFLNIDMMVINELNDLFMNLW